jgi:phosphoglycerate kinase
MILGSGALFQRQISHCLAQGILLSHFERPLKNLLPNGEIDKVKFSLKHVVPYLSALLGKKVDFFQDTIGEKVNQKVEELQNGDVILLENTRFYAGEEKGDPELAKRFASLGEFYINDAFGAAHRAASTSVIADYFDVIAFGFLMKSNG